MLRICNLVVKHIFLCFRMIQMHSDAEDNERTRAVGILTLRKLQGFLYNKEMTAELQYCRKTANLKSFVSAGIDADEKLILHTWKYDAVLYFPF